MLLRRAPTLPPTLARGLTEEEATAVLRALRRAPPASADVCREAVARAELRALRPGLLGRDPERTLARVALATGADGVTLGTRVYVRDTLYAEMPLDLVAHEVAHVAQYLRDGTVPFLLAYVRDYGRHLLAGLDGHRAYLAIRAEREARAVADALAEGA
jgi:hypothetical protein